jgi:Ser/Thr protein kinase RdoA (MazF antagonist)
VHLTVDAGGGSQALSALQPYAGLSPDVVLDAVEGVGHAPDGRLLALNSFENRVYQIGLEDAGFLIAKFYRPGRWSDAAILEEHQFSQELADAELPVVAPQRLGEQTLFNHAGFRFALFPRKGGRAPDLEGLEVSAWLGRLLARIHLIGQRQPFQHRQRVDADTLVWAPHHAAATSPLMPDAVRDRYEHLIEDAADAIDAMFTSIAPGRLRLHGDCHPGNVLWTDAGPHFVDLDDSRSGPAVQDLWMLMTGEVAQREALLEGYEQFRPFDRGELALIPALRLMRQVHYAGWIAERWADPAFPAAFPHVALAPWWEQHCRDIAEALETL